MSPFFVSLLFSKIMRCHNFCMLTRQKSAPTLQNENVVFYIYVTSPRLFNINNMDYTSDVARNVATFFYQAFEPLRYQSLSDSRNDRCVSYRLFHRDYICTKPYASVHHGTHQQSQSDHWDIATCADL